MTSRLFTLLMLVLLGPLPIGAAADESPISVKAEIDKASITIGEPVLYTVTIRHSPDLKVLSPIPAPAEDLFKIQRVEEIREEEGGYKITGRKYKITAFQLGEYILEPVKIEYRLGGGEVQSIETNRIFITVKSVAGGKQAEDIRDIKQTVKIPRNITGLIIVGSVTAGCLLLYFLLRFFKKKQITIAAPEKVLTPEEEAFLHLNQLFDSELLKQNKYKEYFFRFSEILRGYLEKRFKVPAVEQTTIEIMRSIREIDFPPDQRGTLKEILEAADLAKFAKWKPDPSEIVALNKKAKEFIEKAAPKEAPPAVEENKP